MRKACRHFPRVVTRTESQIHFRFHTDLSILSVSGQDNKKLLQSLITNDLSKFNKNEKLAAIAGLMLDNSGRILSPVSVLRPALLIKGEVRLDNEMKLLQVPKDLASLVSNHLNEKKGDRNVEVNDLTEEFDQFCMFVN